MAKPTGDVRKTSVTYVNKLTYPKANKLMRERVRDGRVGYKKERLSKKALSSLWGLAPVKSQRELASDLWSDIPSQGSGFWG